MVMNRMTVLWVGFKSLWVRCVKKYCIGAQGKALFEKWGHKTGKMIMPSGISDPTMCTKHWVITQEGLTGLLRPLKFCGTLSLYFTVNFGLIDVKQTQ